MTSELLTCHAIRLELKKINKKQSDQSNQESVTRSVWLTFKLIFLKN